MKPVFLLILLVPVFGISFSQPLQPGFDPSEYAQTLKADFGHSASGTDEFFPGAKPFRQIYKSPEVGMKNAWTLWTGGNGVAIISIRGTVNNQLSWGANFYAALTPATGSMVLAPNDTFHYRLSSDPKATVHTGWTAALGYLSKGILYKMDSLYKAGTKNFIIAGHSQGGAIGFLLTAYLYQLRSEGTLPGDMVFKTYCSAGPKPGNVYFCYSYEFETRNGWAFNVVNAADWVPETPFSVQTLTDINPTSPFTDAKKKLRKMKFPKNIALVHAYNSIERPMKKLKKRGEKYLGQMMTKMVSPSLPGYEAPVFERSLNYARAGIPVVLFADEEYYKLFPDSKENVFVHHTYKAYRYLLERYYGKKN